MLKYTERVEAEADIFRGKEDVKRLKTLREKT
jgi:hypothetical protein